MPKLIKFVYLTFVLFLYILTACDKKSHEEQYIKPVKVMVLHKIQPNKILRLTGSAKAWRQEKLCFEVNGRVEKVLDENTEVGLYAQKNQDDTINVVGQVVGELDSSRYEAEVAAAKAQLLSAKAETKSILIDIEKLTPQDIKQAQEKVASLDIYLKEILPNELKKTESELKLVRTEYQRTKTLYEQKAAAIQAFDEVKTKLEATESAYNQVNATISSKQRELEAAKAELAKAQVAPISKEALLEVAQAKAKIAESQLQIALRNLSDCKLRTPFSGVISSRIVTKGAVVGPSQPVLVVTMMDPIMIEVAVSAEMARSLQTGDPVDVFPATLNNGSVMGWIEKKSVAADPSTRTYNISCVVRNCLIAPRDGDYHKKGNSISKEDIGVVWKSDPTLPEKSLMVWTDSIIKDEQGGYFAWTIKGFKITKKMRSQEVFITKVKFDLGEGFRSFEKKEYSEVRNPQGLEELMITIRKDFPNLKEGAKVSYVPTDWMIRPGDLVQVSFDFGNYNEGVYIPVEAIMSDDRGHYIFLHEQGKAIKVYVDPLESFRNTRRVESKESLENKEIVVVGAHYVRDQENVIASWLDVK